MKVICDNCGAMYKIPDSKLVKPVNKATCRQCGHRMLIPRPRRGADPDERTLVTAVPPTPPPAPSRSDSGPPTTPIHEPEEKTAPTGGRRTEETRWVRNEVPEPPPPSARPQVRVRGGNTATSQRPQPTPQAKSSNPFDDDDVATQVGPDPTLTYTPREDDPPSPASRPSARPPRATRDDLADSLEEDSDDLVSPDDDDASDEEAPAPPPKARKRGKRKAKAAHDPRGDMGLALFGVLVALIGIAILGVTSVIDVAIADVALYAATLGSAALGLMLAVGGGVGAFLVLLTGGRGSRPAWRVASVIIAVLLALLVGGLPAAARVGYDVLLTGVNAFNDGFEELLAEAERQRADGDADPLTPPDDGSADAMLDGDEPPSDGDGAGAMADDESDTAEQEATDEDGGGAVDKPTDDGGTVEDTPRGTTSRSTTPRTPRSSSSTTRSPRTRPTGDTTGGTTSGGRSAPPDEELDLPDDPLDFTGDDASSRSSSGSSGSSSANSSLPVSPPLTAIDVMVKSNTGVKRCFFEYQKAEGSLPKRVDVRFTIKPDGDATNIETTQRKLTGSELESCLIRSIRGITFPPSQKGTTLTFPFVFG